MAGHLAKKWKSQDFNPGISSFKGASTVGVGFRDGGPCGFGEQSGQSFLREGV